MRKVVIILGIIIVLAGTVMVFKNKKAENEIKNDNNIKITNFEMKDRSVLKIQNSIYVGNNRKELENEFYDIKISNCEQGVSIYLNKLWYKNYDKDYIQEDYLARICREIAKQMNIKYPTEEFEYVLYKYIKENYTKVRNQETVEDLLVEKINMKFELEKNIVKLLIRSNE